MLHVKRPPQHPPPGRPASASPGGRASGVEAGSYADRLLYEKNGRFSARVYNPTRELGTYDTVVQAALAYARAMQETPEPAA